MRTSFPDELWNWWGSGCGGTRGRLSFVEQRVEVCDSRSSRSRGMRVPILYRNTDLLWVGIVGCIDVHGVAVILCRKVKPALLDERGKTNHLGGVSGIEGVLRTGRGHPLEWKSGSLKFLSGGSACSSSRTDRRGWLKILVTDITSKETS